MTAQLYACVHAEEFPAQALLRLRTDLASQPVAVLPSPRSGRPVGLRCFARVCSALFASS